MFASCSKSLEVQVADLSFEESLKVAETGNVEAMYTVGLTYLSGEETPRDISEAHKWIRLAANAGNEDAKLKLPELRELFLDEVVVPEMTKRLNAN